MDSKKKEETVSRRKFTGRNHPKIPYGAEVTLIETAFSKVRVKYNGESFWIPSGRAQAICSAKDGGPSQQDLDCIAHLPL